MEIKEPEIKESSFSFVTSIWLVPIVSAIVALWLVYEHYSKLGPEIKIEFESSGGLTAGQSVVKFRDVEVGKVTQIKINTDKEGVVVYARLNSELKPFLNKQTKFWIIKPEVDYSGIRGLDTLLSGSYINMYSKKKSTQLVKNYKGLKRAFVDLNDAYYYIIESEFPVKVKKTTPLFFKGMQVGEINNLYLNSNNKKILIEIKLYEKYYGLINETTNFWVQSIVNLKFTNDRLDINVAPLPSVLLGAIEFNTRFDGDYKDAPSKRFVLYKSETEAKRNRLKYIKPIYKNVKFEFKSDINYIDVGMAIKYKNISIGTVDKIDISYNKNKRKFYATSYGQIDISNFGATKKDAISNFKEILDGGLIAKLSKDNPIFNKSNITLEESNATNATLNINDETLLFATKETESTDVVALIKDLTKKLSSIDFAKTMNKVDTILDKSKQPIDKLNALLSTTTKTIKSLDKVVNSKDFKGITKNLNSSLKELGKTLKETKKTLKGYGENSLFSDKLQETLKELHNSAEQTNRLLRKLNKKPNSLIFGD